MDWRFLVGFLVLVSLANEFLMKVIANRVEKKSQIVFYRYLFCFILAFGFFLWLWKMGISQPLFLLTGFIGAVAVMAVYCKWRALKISLSKTALFVPLADGLVIFLAWLVSKETASWFIWLGALFCFSAIVIFRWPSKEQREQKVNKEFWLFIGLMVVIFGLSGFFVRVYALRRSLLPFLLAWYGGHFLASFFLLGFEKANPLKIRLVHLLLILLVAITAFSGTSLLFTIYQQGGLAIQVLPLSGVFALIGALLMGWFLFKERRGLVRKEWLGFVLGALGAVLILLA